MSIKLAAEAGCSGTKVISFCNAATHLTHRHHINHVHATQQHPGGVGRRQRHLGGNAGRRPGVGSVHGAVESLELLRMWDDAHTEREQHLGGTLWIKSVNSSEVQPTNSPRCPEERAAAPWTRSTACIAKGPATSFDLPCNQHRLAHHWRSKQAPVGRPTAGIVAANEAHLAAAASAIKPPPAAVFAGPAPPLDALQAVDKQRGPGLVHGQAQAAVRRRIPPLHGCWRRRRRRRWCSVQSGRPIGASMRCASS